MRDCIFLLADSNMKAAFEGFLSRDQFHCSINCGVFSFNPTLDLVVAAADNDPGLYTRGHELLRPYSKTHKFAVIVLDAEWNGSPGANAIRQYMTENIKRTGWDEDRFKVIVIDPELEMWIWQKNHHIAEALGFSSLDNLMNETVLKMAWPQGQLKPIPPKETLEAILKKNRIPRSSSIYKKITSRVSVNGCMDASFQELLTTLRTWFLVEAQ